MFQNISGDFVKNQNEDVKLDKKGYIKDVLKRLFSKQNIVLYVISFMISMVRVCFK